MHWFRTRSRRQADLKLRRLQCAALNELNDHQLRDVGFIRAMGRDLTFLIRCPGA